MKVERVEGVWGGRYYMVPNSRIPIFAWADTYRDGGKEAVEEAWPHLTASQNFAAFEFMRDEPEKVIEDRERYRQDIEENAPDWFLETLDGGDTDSTHVGAD